MIMLHYGKGVDFFCLHSLKPTFSPFPFRAICLWFYGRTVSFREGKGKDLSMKIHFLPPSPVKPGESKKKHTFHAENAELAVDLVKLS